jgi:Zn-finger protein
MKNGTFFYNNKECEYFPCHKGIPEEDFNCMLCYCPLYMLGPDCGGNFEYLLSGIKSCMNCNRPHDPKRWDEMMGMMKVVVQKVQERYKSEDPEQEEPDRKK